MNNNVNLITNIYEKPISGIQSKATPSTGANFSDVLNNALNQVVDDVKTAEALSKQLAAGEVKDLHQVMIAMEKANLGLQLTVQVRNKVVEAYQEVMRMQI